MMLVALLLLEAIVAVIIILGWRGLSRAQIQARRVRAALAEIYCLANAKQRLRERGQRAGKAVDTATDSVEAVHRALANLSFDLWGSNNPEARDQHDLRVQQVYGGVRGLNRLLGRQVSSWLGEGQHKQGDDDK